MVDGNPVTVGREPPEKHLANKSCVTFPHQREQRNSLYFVDSFKYRFFGCFVVPPFVSPVLCSGTWPASVAILSTLALKEMLLAALLAMVAPGAEVEPN